MKYTTKELMSKTQEEIDSICGVQCETKHCLFKKSLWKYRFDGSCLKNTIQLADNAIHCLESEIDAAKGYISRCKNRIKFHKKRIKAIEKELENDK